MTSGDQRSAWVGFNPRVDGLSDPWVGSGDPSENEHGPGWVWVEPNGFGSGSGLKMNIGTGSGRVIKYGLTGWNHKTEPVI